MLSHAKSTRYILVAAATVLVVLTVYYTQTPWPLTHEQHFSPWRSSHHPHSPTPPTPPPPPPPPSLPSQHSQTPLDPIWDNRTEQVREAFLHAYHGYLKYADGYDQLRPLSKTGRNNFNGWNVTMYDSLDTMLLMGLHEEFAAALPVVQGGNFRQSSPPFSETVIRYLGGLLSAYALSREPMLLAKADELGTLLEPAFDTLSGFPDYAVNTGSGKPISRGGGVLAEIASCQMEWSYLAYATDGRSYFDKGDQVIRGLTAAMKARQGGMLPTRWNLATGMPVGDGRSLGAAADSGHEYLLKQYLLTDKQDVANLEMYLLTMNEVLTRLIYVTPGRQMLYVTDTVGGAFQPSHIFEHLACFFPGLLALGAHTLPLNLSSIAVEHLNPEAQRAYRLLENYNLRELHMAAAEGLATSCWLLYKEMPTGLGPEYARMNSESTLWIDALEEWRLAGAKGPLPGLNTKTPILYTKEASVGGPWQYIVGRPEYFLRPETVESLYIMWRVTGDPIWRERGWDIFQALEKEAKTDAGYASVQDIIQTPAPKHDEQPSFFLAETLKYLYLLFHNDDPVPLDKWVFNTEAHPLPIFSWNEWQKNKFNISNPITVF